MKKNVFKIFSIAVGVCVSGPSFAADTVALWLFDEPEWLYPSHTLDSSGGLDSPMVLGLGGTLTEGKWDRALSTVPHAKVDIPDHGEATASLDRLTIPAGRTQEPLTWHTANFAALMTGGENHLRKEVSFVNPTDTDLNLGDFDWTVEFWLKLGSSKKGEGVIFEIGSGPRAENEMVTRLTLDAKSGYFSFSNAATGKRVELRSAAKRLKVGVWSHCAFTYLSDDDALTLYVDGDSSESASIEFDRLPEGKESYVSIGRDGYWNRPLEGAIDELRISRGLVYAGSFEAPNSFAPAVPKIELSKGVPLRFGHDAPKKGVLQLGSSKHVFWDDALLESSEGISFNTRQPKYIERVVEGLLGQVRKHLTVIEDEQGMIRIYHGVADDYLGIRISHDGVNFEVPDTGYHWKGDKNVVIPEPAPLGRPIIDPNGPPEHRWKYVSGLEGRGVYLYTSPDGWKWMRHRTAVLPFRSGSQSSLYYDEQRQLYVGFQRTGHPMTAGGGTSREFVISETADVYSPWPVDPLTQAEAMKIAETRPLRYPIPWWMDNGPLTPGDFSVEMPTVFAPDNEVDPGGSGIYVPKAMKYPWAEDAYISFPAMYYDYEEPQQPLTRRILYHPSYKKGSGTMESHVAVSRDGVSWKRFMRPAYIPMDTYQDREIHQIYMSEGMIRRGDEIWQYFYGQEEYHSPAVRNKAGNGIYRAVQRLDGFVSADTPYDQEITVMTRPFTFDGKRLELNIDTGALGYALVGILDEKGKPIPGFESDNCVWINGNYIAHEVEWLNSKADLSEVTALNADKMRHSTLDISNATVSDLSKLAGKTIRLQFRMRGTSLFAMQFVE